MTADETVGKLRNQLSAISFHCTQEAGTEPAFSGTYLNEKRPGFYCCVVCEATLFDSDTKYESQSGWPSFWQALLANSVSYESDTTYGMLRVEVLCNRCDAHLGHVFDDGSPPDFKRY